MSTAAQPCASCNRTSVPQSQAATVQWLRLVPTHIASCDLAQALQEPAPPGAGLHELNMLARLIKQPKAQQASNFKLNLFASSPQPAGEFACAQCPSGQRME